MEGGKIKTAPLKLFVFDLDGTLIDNDVDFKSMKRSLADYISQKYGLKKPLYDEGDKTKDVLRKAVSILRNRGIEISEGNLLKEVDHILKKYEWEGAKNSKLRKCSKKLLEYLKECDFKVALLTNEPCDIVDFILEKLSIKELFDVVVTRDSIGELKPSIKGIKVISEKMEVRESDIVFVGDSSIDSKTAEIAGCRFWFVSEDSIPSDLKSEIVVKDLCELLEILRGIRGLFHK
ncbi:MAG: HAD family hydrolase [Candidatus Asgardarchaeia archaeon]